MQCRGSGVLRGGLGVLRDDTDGPDGREKADAASFRETTLDDLESTRMSTTQKAIIVVAVLGVIAFTAWYLLAH